MHALSRISPLSFLVLGPVLGACSCNPAGSDASAPDSGADSAVPPPDSGGTDSGSPVPTGGRYEWDLATEIDGQEAYYTAVAFGGFFGTPTEAGDLDCDGVDDVFLGSMRANTNGADSGEGHIFFSDSTIAGLIDVGNPGTNVITRVRGHFPGDFFAVEAKIADLNGDGCGDLLVGAQNIDGPPGAGGAPGTRTSSGALYVFFGRPTWPADIDLAAGATAGVLRIYGAVAGDRFGMWMEDMDLDGDGVRDLMSGADQFDWAGKTNVGATYIIRGDTTWSAAMPDTSIDLASGLPAGTTVVYGKDMFDHAGATHTGADVDGNGHEDILIAAGLNRLSASGPTGADPAGGGGDGPPTDARAESGEVYVIWNDGALPAEIDLANPGAVSVLTIYGADAGDFFGEDLYPGDINDDGYADIVIGALAADSIGNSRPDAGEAYVLFGTPALAGAISIDMRTPPAGVTIFYGVAPDDIAGDTSAIGDFNGDGYDDFATGSPQNDAAPFGDPARFDAGRVDVYYGGPNSGVWPWPAVIEIGNPPADMNVGTIIGADVSDLISYSMDRGDIDNDGVDDIIPNAMRGDGFGNGYGDTGEGYVISGAVLWQHILDDATF